MRDSPVALYNENDPYCAQWLRNLIDAGHIAPGVVDERSIEDITPDELRGYTQVHCFAGIGIWSYALRLAGWPDDRPVWTGSCPCQPFSAAGKGAGFADERHLWPAWFHLIRECRPAVVFGEQVAAASDWLNLVRSDLEGMGYAMGAMPVEAASAGADHFRDRYWIVAHHDEQRASARQEQRGGELCRTSRDSQDHAGPVADGHIHGGSAGVSGSKPWDERHAGIVVDRSHQARALADRPCFGWGEGWTEHDFRSRGFAASVVGVEGSQYVECTDGKQPVWRRLPPPGVRWLGTGVAARVAKLRAIGNAIDARPTAAWIRAYIEARQAVAESEAA